MLTNREPEKQQQQPCPASPWWNRWNQLFPWFLLEIQCYWSGWGPRILFLLPRALSAAYCLSLSLPLSMSLTSKEIILDWEELPLLSPNDRVPQSMAWHCHPTGQSLNTLNLPGSKQYCLFPSEVIANGIHHGKKNQCC